MPPRARCEPDGRERANRVRLHGTRCCGMAWARCEAKEGCPSRGASTRLQGRVGAVWREGLKGSDTRSVPGMAARERCCAGGRGRRAAGFAKACGSPRGGWQADRSWLKRGHQENVKKRSVQRGLVMWLSCADKKSEQEPSRKKECCMQRCSRSAFCLCSEKRGHSPLHVTSAVCVLEHPTSFFAAFCCHQLTLPQII